MDDVASRFADAAADYIAWIESRGEREVGACVESMMRHLARLYSLGLELQKPAEWGDHERETRSCDEWRELVKELEVPFNYYWKALDPHAETDLDENSGANELLDDLADIAGDLEEGLLLHRDGLATEAVAHWTTMFFHWGEHATEALAALHHWAQFRREASN